MKKYIRKYLKYAIVVALLVAIYPIYYFNFTGDVSNVSCAIGKSVDNSPYSEQEIEEAFEKVKGIFKHNYYDCQLVKMTYYEGRYDNEIKIDCEFICNRKGNGPGNILGDGSMNCMNYYLKRVNGKWKYVEKGLG